MLSEKIAAQRKRFGWSQEELAEQLEVSRQSVSKWESGASLPELDKILALSALFGVSTDYLLKDGLDEVGDAPEAPEIRFEGGAAAAYAEAPEEMPEARRVFVPDEVEDGLRVLDDGEAHRFLENRRQCAPVVGRGVGLCVASPVPLVGLLALAIQSPSGFLSTGMAVGVGVLALLGMVAAGVGQFITAGMRMSKYSYIDKEPFLLAEELHDDVSRQKQGFRAEFSRTIAEGVGLCILSPVPVAFAAIAGMGGLMIPMGVGLLLAMVALGAGLITRDGIVMGSFDHVLQEGDHALRKKLRRYKLTHLVQRAGDKLEEVIDRL